jgi:predicted amidophosphoribosyltransferase
MIATRSRWRAAIGRIAAPAPWRAAGAALADLLLPSLCPACAIACGPGLCPACAAAVETLAAPCRWCAAPGGARHLRCPACENHGLPHLDRVHIACAYRGVVERLVGGAKAGGSPAAARALGALLPPLDPLAAADAETAASAAVVVVPIPPAPGRRSGPHLGTALARALAHREGLPLRRLLRLTRLAAEQHRLNRGERARNVEGLFASAPAPRRVLLVDDLMTSGATASAAAAALRRAGARRVDLVCVARTPRNHE